MKRIKALAMINALSFILQLVFFYLAQAGNLNIQTLKKANELHTTMITPAIMSFGIWGIIFTTIAILCLYHIIMAYKHDLTNPANYELSRMGPWFLLTNIAAIGWLMAVTNDMLLLSMLLMFAQVICLMIIHFKLRIYNLAKAAGVKVATQFPLSIYLGWIIMMCILNIAAYLNTSSWDRFGLKEHEWSVIFIIIALAVSSWMTLARKNIYIGLVTAWFLFGILKKLKNVEGDASNSIYLSAWAAIGILLIFCIYRLVRNIQYKKPREIFPLTTTPLK